MFNRSFLTNLICFFLGCLIIFTYTSYFQKKEALNSEGPTKEKSSLVSLYGRTLSKSTYAYPEGRITVRNVAYTHPDLSTVSVEAISEYVQFMVNKAEVHCSTNQRFGRTIDGGWDLCLVGPFKPKEPCSVLSFGINGDFTFDDEISKQLKCTVYAFDPTMNVGDHKRGDKIFFKKQGIFGRKENLPGVGPVDTLFNIKKALNLDKGAVDMMKMDVEWSEYSVFKTAFQDGSLSNIKQFAFELHFPTKTSLIPKDVAKQILDVMDGLFKAGFRMWKFNWNNYCNEMNSLNVHRSYCHELYFININFLDDSHKLNSNTS